MSPAGRGRPPAPWRLHAAIQAGRFALGLLPGGALWGLDAVRWIPAPAALAVAALALVSIVPAACERALAGARRARGLPAGLKAVLAAAVPALLACAMPDRVAYSGDVLMRWGAVAAGELVAAFPQTLPLDALLDQSLARALAVALGGSLVVANRVLGAATVLCTGLAAAWIAGREAGDRRWLVPLLTGFSGLLLAATGSGRPDAAATLLAVVVVGRAYRDLASPSRWPILEAAFVTGLYLHRSMLMLAPLALVVIARVVAFRGRAGDPPVASGRRLAAVALAIPAVAILPTYGRIVATFDAVHHLAPRGWGLVQLSDALSPRALLEAANALLLVAPAVPLLVLVAWRARRGTSEAFRFVAAFSLGPWLLALLFAHPQQGLVRDFASFAALGGIGGLLLGLHLVREGSRDWGPAFAAGVTLAVGAAMLPPLVLWTTPAAAVARLEAFAAGERGAPAQRADAWSFLARLHERAGRPREALAVLLDAYAIRPAPLVRAQILLDAARSGEYATARRVAAEALASGSGDAFEWLVLTGSAQALGDSAGYRDAADSLRLRVRDPVERSKVRRVLGLHPELWPGPRPGWLQEIAPPRGG